MQSSLAVIAGPSAEKGSWARWYVAEADVGGGELVLSLEPWPIRFTCHDRSSAFLWADQNFRVVVPEVGPGAGQYKVNTRGYIYSIGRGVLTRSPRRSASTVKKLFAAPLSPFFTRPQTKLITP
jgi:hypothetical protein